MLNRSRLPLPKDKPLPYAMKIDEPSRWDQISCLYRSSGHRFVDNDHVLAQSPGALLNMLEQHSKHAFDLWKGMVSISHRWTLWAR